MILFYSYLCLFFSRFLSRFLELELVFLRFMNRGFRRQPIFFALLVFRILGFNIQQTAFTSSLLGTSLRLYFL